MEVKGSVVVCDSSDVVGINDLACSTDHGKPDTSNEVNSNKRIVVSNFKKHVRALKVYSVFAKFGTVTYFLTRKQNAILEFSDRSTVESILKCKYLKIDGSHVDIKLLPKFHHADNFQLEFFLHSIIGDLKTINAFNKFVSHLHKKSISKRKQEDDEKLCRLIQSIVRREYPECIVHPFGSRISGLSLPECDLDLFLDCGDMYDGSRSNDPLFQQELVSTTSKLLIRNDEFSRVEKVLKARVPILKFYHSPSQTHCDIAFLHGLGCENTKLLKFLQTVDSRLQPFIIFLKEWAFLHDVKTVNNQSHFTSYALVMMVVMYLQSIQKPVLPSIQTLSDLFQGNRKLIAGWDCSFITDPRALPKFKNNDTVFELTLGFFDYYRSFDFEHFVICPYMGKPIPKEILANVDQQKKYFPFYAKYCEDGREKFKLSTAVCVQDPFEHSHNVTRNVKDDVLMNFISACALSYESLSQIN